MLAVPTKWLSQKDVNDNLVHLKVEKNSWEVLYKSSWDEHFSIMAFKPDMVSRLSLDKQRRMKGISSEKFEDIASNLFSRMREEDLDFWKSIPIND